MAPGHSDTFNLFSDPRVSGSNVAFSGRYGNDYGIYTGVAGSYGVTRIADQSITVPGQSGMFTGFGGTLGLALSGSNIVFIGSGNSGSGIYTGVAGITGVSRLVDYTSTIPGQSAKFSGFSAVALSGNNVVFLAGDAGNRSSIYTTTVGSPAINRVADSSTRVPNQAATVTFSNIGVPIISGSNVAFYGNFYPAGSGSESTGIFLFRDGNLLDVAETGEPLFGSTISSLGGTSYTRDQKFSLDGDTLAFSYTLANGVTGIATFTVPEPSTWLGGALLLGASALTLRRRLGLA